jgi:hypothetical protein
LVAVGEAEFVSGEQSHGQQVKQYAELRAMSSAGRVAVDGSCPVLIGRSFRKDFDEVVEF